MKPRVIFLCLALSLAVFIGACAAGGTNRESEATGASNSAPKPETKVKVNLDEIREVLAAHDKALSDKNLDAIMATFSTNPTTVVLGTSAEERWMGTQEIRGAYTEILKDYDPGTLVTNCATWKTGGSDDNGTMAWLAATCDCKDSLKGKAREYKLNVSATVEKQDGKWRFVSLHMSNAPPQGPPTK